MAAISARRGLPSATLVFIRHGETDWNVERRLQGQQDTPINDNGRAQAARNGRTLKSIAGVKGFDFASSPLQRAAETMRIVRSELGLAPGGFRTDPALIEITFGTWEGSTLEELAAVDPDAVRRRQADKWGYVPPGGESYRMIRDRVRSWLATIQTDTVAVSHGAVGRVVQGIVFGIAEHDVPSLPSPQDRMLVWRDGRGEWM